MASFLPRTTSSATPTRSEVYRIINLVERVVEVHRAPHGTRYQQVRGFARLPMLAFPDVVLRVDDFLRDSFFK